MQINTIHQICWNYYTGVRSWTSDNISSAHGERLSFCSHDCHNRLWGDVRIQTWRISASISIRTYTRHALLYVRRVPTIPMSPDFIQLLDDDIVSLTALMLMMNPQCRDDDPDAHYISISQLTLSLYLMTQCQLKLHHSVTSLAQILHYIKVAQRIHLADETLIQLTLKLIEHKVVTYVNTLLWYVLSLIRETCDSSAEAFCMAPTWAHCSKTFSTRDAL